MSTAVRHYTQHQKLWEFVLPSCSPLFAYVHLGWCQGSSEKSLSSRPLQSRPFSPISAAGTVMGLGVNHATSQRDERVRHLGCRDAWPAAPTLACLSAIAPHSHDLVARGEPFDERSRRAGAEAKCQPNHWLIQFGQ